MAFLRNDLLVDQTIVCEASRVFADSVPLGQLDTWNLNVSGWVPPITDRLLQLSMLLDAIAIHDNLYVLEGELTEEAKSLELRNILLSKGIIQELNTVPFCDVITQELSEYLAQITKTVSWSGDFDNSNRDRYQDSLVQAIASFLGGGTQDATIDNSVDRANTEPKESLFSPYGHNWREKIPEELRSKTTTELKHLAEESFLIYAFDDEKVNQLRSNPLLFLGQRLVKGFGHHPTGGSANTNGASLLRTFLYWRISEHARINLYPCSRRMAEISLLTDHIRISIAREVMKIITGAFKDSVEAAYFSEPNIPLILPPTLAIFLDCYRTRTTASPRVYFRSRAGEDG